MLEQRVINTIRFFDLQNLPLTGFEVFKYLITDEDKLKTVLDESRNLSTEADTHAISYDTVAKTLDQLVTDQKIGQHRGYYYLLGKQSWVEQRLRNYLYGIYRERLIAVRIQTLRHIPFVRGVALAGSQALGQEKKDSDIDLLIITERGFMWLARTLVTGYFQLLGLRRHGKKITNRFCLNHYIASPKQLGDGRNIYTALEYAKLRPLVYPEAVAKFQDANQRWIKTFFPHIQPAVISNQKQSRIQGLLERLLHNSFGHWIEYQLQKVQIKRIHQEQKYIVVRDDELSFHPMSKEEGLLAEFFNQPVSSRTPARLDDVSRSDG